MRFSLRVSRPFFPEMISRCSCKLLLKRPQLMWKLIPSSLSGSLWWTSGWSAWAGFIPPHWRLIRTSVLSSLHIHEHCPPCASQSHTLTCVSYRVWLQQIYRQLFDLKLVNKKTKRTAPTGLMAPFVTCWLPPPPLFFNAESDQYGAVLAMKHKHNQWNSKQWGRTDGPSS